MENIQRYRMEMSLMEHHEFTEDIVSDAGVNIMMHIKLD